MWMECISDRAYERREDLGRDVVRVLREELFALLAAGAALVQFDEPVLSEVAYGAAGGKRSFMCGALGEKGAPADELAFAEELLAAVTAGAPRERLALHVCRGNWSPDESVALSGDYAPLLGVLSRAPVGAVVLEMCTPRAGDVELLRALPDDRRNGIGVVNQKTPTVESIDEIAARIATARDLFGAERLLLHPDCGFATFADNPICTPEIAEAKLANVVAARERVR
jgi:5-methyltetrahydropteroyltriglutamate--homocysteine methyltransferase